MEQQVKTRKKYPHKFASVRYTPEEWAQLKARIKNSTARSITEYLRKVTLDEPTTQYYRNRSLDEWIAQAIALTNELQLIQETAYWKEEQHQRFDASLEKIEVLLNKIFDYVRKIHRFNDSQRHPEIP